MIEADEGRRPKYLPFFIVRFIAIVISCEFFFGTLQIQSSLRGESAHFYAAETNHKVKKMVNETIETLLARLPKQSVNDQRLVLLEDRLSSLENAFNAHVKRDEVNELRSKIASVSTEAKEDAIHGERNATYCVSWETNTDEWWTHHPDWYVSQENDTHYCFSPIKNRRKAAIFRKLYQVQFKTGDCSKVITKQMWSSGWGADLENVVDALVNAYKTGIPAQVHVVEDAWHYAGKKGGSRPVCDSKDMYCYFLNMTRCKPNIEMLYEGTFIRDDYALYRGIGRWLLEYATRQQTWLRREVYEFSKNVKIQTPCTAMHVRRTDVVLHDENARKYRKIEEYVSALDNSRRTFGC